MSTQITKNYEETQHIGKEFAKELHAGDVITLYGDLGAGKTTFMQGLAMGLGISHRIISPTFIIVRKYDTSVKRKALSVKRLYHIDLYRTETQDDLQGIGLTEILEDKDAVTSIEWPEKMGELLPEKRWEIHFRYLSESEREIKVMKF